MTVARRMTVARHASRGMFFCCLCPAPVPSAALSRAVRDVPPRARDGPRCGVAPGAGRRGARRRVGTGACQRQQQSDLGRGCLGDAHAARRWRRQRTANIPGCRAAVTCGGAAREARRGGRGGGGRAHAGARGGRPASAPRKCSRCTCRGGPNGGHPLRGRATGAAALKRCQGVYTAGGARAETRGGACSGARRGDGHLQQRRGGRGGGGVPGERGRGRVNVRRTGRRSGRGGRVQNLPGGGQAQGPAQTLRLRRMGETRVPQGNVLATGATRDADTQPPARSFAARVTTCHTWLSLSSSLSLTRGACLPLARRGSWRRAPIRAKCAGRCTARTCASRWACTCAP